MIFKKEEMEAYSDGYQATSRLGESRVSYRAIDTGGRSVVLLCVSRDGHWSRTAGNIQKKKNKVKKRWNQGNEDGQTDKSCTGMQMRRMINRLTIIMAARKLNASVERHRERVSGRERERERGERRGMGGMILKEEA